MKKKISALIYTAAALLLAAACAIAAEYILSASCMKKVSPEVSASGEKIRIAAFDSKRGPCVCLQSALAGNVSFAYDGAFSLYVNGEKHETGKEYDLAGTETLELRTGLKKARVNVLAESALPCAFIETESGGTDAIHADKEHKESGNFVLVEDGAVTLDASLSYIKGRGNSTWETDKKPYNIKFDEKTELLGMPKAKKWCLLSQPDGFEYPNNALAFYFAGLLGLPCSPHGAFVQLYLNGEYAGLYLLTEKIEVGKNRVDVPDLDEANEEANPDVDISECARRGSGDSMAPGSMKWVELPSEPENITGGYLIEIDREAGYADEPCGFVSDSGQFVVIKSPEFASEREVEYISGVFNAAELSASGDNGDVSYEDYFDVDALTGYFIL